MDGSKVLTQKEIDELLRSFQAGVERGAGAPAVLDQAAMPSAGKCRVLPAYSGCRRGSTIHPTDLTPEPPSHWAAYTERAEEQFRVGSIDIPVVSNVYHMPGPELSRAYVAVKLAGDGVDGIREQMSHAVSAMEEECGRSRPIGGETPEPESIQRLVGQLRGVSTGFSPVSVDRATAMLQEWDQASQALYDLFPKPGCPPVVTFLRDGFFLPRQVYVGGVIYPAGCYIADEPPRERTAAEKEEYNSSPAGIVRLHELAHAAMALRRLKREVEGCPWMDEAWANYLVGSKLGWYCPRPERLEYEMHLGWKYLYSPRVRAGEILVRWQDPQSDGPFCEDVRKLRRLVQLHPAVARVDYPWEAVEAAGMNEQLQRGKPVSAARKRYSSEALRCPQCHATSEELSWFYFSNQGPRSGQAGWMVVCDKCRVQVDFIEEEVWENQV